MEAEARPVGPRNVDAKLGEMFANRIFSLFPGMLDYLVNLLLAQGQVID